MRRARSSALLLVLLLAAACYKPATLTPAGVVAFNATRVVKALDVLRDFAVDANAQTPPLLTTATTRTVVTYHRAAVSVIGQSPSGWVPIVVAGLEQLQTTIPAPEYQRLAPYVSLVSTLVKELSK
jgi:hypothetical protein